jgi:hypothetical protein
LPTGFEPAIKTMVTDTIIDHNAASLPVIGTVTIIVAADSIKAYPAAGRNFTFRRQV